jgi:hypothetical protein
MLCLQFNATQHIDLENRTTNYFLNINIFVMMKNMMKKNINSLIASFLLTICKL